MIFCIASLAVLVLFNLAPSLADDDYAVDFTVRPTRGYRIYNAIFVYGDYGCGSGNSKCRCTTDRDGVLTMIGRGTSGSLTGLTFSCNFKIEDVPCKVSVDLNYGPGDNQLSCGCTPPGGAKYTWTFDGCSIGPKEKDITKTLPLNLNQDQICTGTRDKTAGGANTNPSGVYSANNIKFMGAEVTYVELTFPTFTGVNTPVDFKQVVKGCVFMATAPNTCIPISPDGSVVSEFTYGFWNDNFGNNGSQLIPVDKPNLSPFEKFIDQALLIHWCPSQNYFLVKILGIGPFVLLKRATMFAPVIAP